MRLLQYILTTIAAALTLCACAQDMAQTASDTATGKVVTLDLSADKATAITISLVDTLSMTMPARVPTEMAVLTPSGETIFLHGESYGARLWDGDTAPETLTIDLDTLQGRHWKGGTPSDAHAFATPGTHTLIMSDNLETEPENTYGFTINVDVTE